MKKLILILILVSGLLSFANAQKKHKKAKTALYHIEFRGPVSWSDSFPVQDDGTVIFSDSTIKSSGQQQYSPHLIWTRSSPTGSYFADSASVGLLIKNSLISRKPDTTLVFALVRPDDWNINWLVGYAAIDRDGKWHEDKLRENGIYPTWVLSRLISTDNQQTYYFMDGSKIEQQVLISIEVANPKNSYLESLSDKNKKSIFLIELNKHK